MATSFPTIFHYVTAINPDGTSSFHDSPNPPPSVFPNPAFRVDYIYSSLASTTGPSFAENADLKNHLDVAVHSPYIMFPTAGGSVAIVLNFGPNPTGEWGLMHRTNTLDYLFVINGELELALDSGEKRVLKAGDAVVQRGPMHAWRNLSKTEPARMAGVALGVEGAVKDEIFVQGHK